MIRSFTSRVSLIASLSLAASLSLSSGAPVPPTDNTSQPYLATYEWGLGTANFTARNAFAATWLSRSQVWAEEFTATDTWDNLRGPAWLLNPAQTFITANPARKYILSVGLLPGPVDGSGPTSGIGAGVAVSLEQGAAGAYNSHFTALAQNLVAKGLANNTILRLGWEFNGTWYAWRANNTAKAQSYAEYFRQIVTTMRSVSGASGLKFCWNPNNGWNSYPLTDAYPGDAYVDYIGPDLYDQCWAANTYPYGAPLTNLQRQQNAWTDLSSTSNNQLGWFKNFAATHGKKLVIPEWGAIDRPDGHGGKDNPYYIQKMYEFIHEPANNVYFHCYFNINGSEGNRQITPFQGFVTSFPNTAAKYQELFKVSSMFEDTFSDGNATGWTPGNAALWSVVSDAGDYGYKFNFDWTNTTGSSTTGQSSWTNYTLTADVKITDLSATWSETRIYARHVDASNHYWLALADEGGAAYRKLHLYKRVAGTTTKLATASITLSANTWYEVEFKLNGSAITAKLNGTQLISVTDSALSSGKIGLGGYKQDVIFDNITVAP